MKKLLAISLLLLLLPSLASASISLGHANIGGLTNNLFVYLPLDGNVTNWTTGITQDISGTGLNFNGLLNAMSTTTSPVPGKIGQAMRFDGSTQYISGSINSFSSLGAVSMCAWANKYSNPSGITQIAGAGDAAGGILIDSSGAVYGSLVFAGVGTQSTSHKAMPAGWHHYCTIWSNGNPVSLYKDGALMASTGNVTDTVNSFSGIYWVGRQSGGVYFNGAIDDVRFYRRALSPQELVLLYALGTVNVGHSPSTSSGQATTGLNSGLVGYWSLDGNTINWNTKVLADISGQGNNCNLISMPTSTSVVAGKVGQALKFAASSSWCQNTISQHPTLDITGDLTMSAWMISTSTAGNQDIMRAGQGTDNRYALFFDGSLKRLQFSWYNGTSFVVINSNSNVVPLNKWTYVTVVRSGTNLIFYANGVAIGSGTFTTAPNVPANFTIGGTNTGAQPFIGSLDDLRLYNRALSAQEVALLYASGQVYSAHSNASATTGLNSGLVGYWTFDGPSVNWATGVVKDVSGNGNNGLMTGPSTSTSPVAGKIGQALNFNGTSSYIDLAAPTVLQSDSVFTVSAWARATSYGVNPAAVAIRFNQDANNLFILYPYDNFSGNGARVFFNTITIIDQNNGAIADGKWHHFLFVSRSATDHQLFVDGQSVGTSVTSKTLPASLTDVTIGAWNPTNGQYYSGGIDDVRIYNRALSSQEIAQLYAMGK